MNKQTIHEIIEQEKQDLEDAKRIVMNIEKLESKDKPLVKKIRDRYPQ
jgi:precorrin-6B methylase 2